MDNKYMVVISNQNLYREVELGSGEKMFTIGTLGDCDYRLRKDLFFQDFKVGFMKKDGKWNIVCSNNIYINKGDSRKLLTTSVVHGSIVNIMYQASNQEIFEVEFRMNFDTIGEELKRQVNIANRDKIYIGAGQENDIVIRSNYVYNDKVEMTRNNQSMFIRVYNESYEVCHNGNKIYGDAIINNGDFFSISDFKFYYKDNVLWTEATDRCIVNNLEYIDKNRYNKYPHFTRNTRVKYCINKDNIDILDPPDKPKKPTNHIITSLLPGVGILASGILMASMGGTMMILGLISGVIGIITTIIGMVQSNSDFKKSLQERIDKYNNYIVNKRREIEGYRSEELYGLNQIYISMEEKLKRFNEFSPDLFDRSIEDDDFLDVRIGTGLVSALRKINYKKRERLEVEDGLQLIPGQICKEYEMIPNAPIVCNLKKMCGLGVTGMETHRYELLKTIVLDICARQYYSDVKMFFIVEEEHINIARKFRYLPYVNNTEIHSKNIVCDEESKKLVFEYLYNEFMKRERSEEEREHLVIFLYDNCGFGTHPISKFVDKADKLGVTFVFFADDKSLIPMGCEKIIQLEDDYNALLIDTNDRYASQKFAYDKVSEREIYSIVQMLSAVKTEEISLEGSLTKNISLFDMLDILVVEDLNLQERWQKSQVHKSMSVPLGVAMTGVVNLDLHDKAHGPHGLVAGTTGSGKSEILQSYILSIATYFHPYEVAFLIIDFKGGGMVNQFKELPHLLGAITNIDGKEIDRSLKSIKAELQKRQRLFAYAEVNHIDKYIQKYKKQEVDVPLPHLIIIVDEFAELKAEQPEFMKELISAARIGRSLGVHLILATQKPSGQVDEQIWSNSRFKLCLKVQGPEDSNEVLKSPLAAEIKEPGRAYLQVGNNEIFKLFQSAYSGCFEKEEHNAIKAFKISKVELSGKRNIVFEQKKAKVEAAGRTQLEAVVNYVDLYCKHRGIEKLSSICMEALSEVLVYEEDYEKIRMRDLDIGIYDDPDNQYQGPTWLDIDTKHTFVIGSSQYGKTNLLQLIIRQIASKYRPSEANIYILDFGSMVLKNFESLNHVGGVVCSSDDEKLKNLFKLLIEEIAIRKEKLLSAGVSSFAAYKEAGYRDLPHIYVLVDNISALIEIYLENDDTFLGIIREGIAVGISIIMTNSHTAGIGYKYLSNFANKIALYCNDSTEYGNIFEHVDIKPDDIPGRCVFELEKRLLECQTYLAFSGDKEYDRMLEVKSYIEYMNSKCTGERAKMIPYIPAVLTRNMLEESYIIKREDYKLPIGLTYSEVEPFYLDFSKLGALGICGKPNKGHFNFVVSVLTRLNETRVVQPVKVCIFDDISRKYKGLSNLGIVESYSADPSLVKDKIKEWHKILEFRYQAMLNEQNNIDNTLLVMVIQNNDVARTIADDIDLMEEYRDIVTKFKALNVCIIYSNYENAAVSFDSPEPLRLIKQEQHLLLLDDLDNLKVFDIAYEELRNYKKKLKNGDAYYINDNIVTKLKMLKYE